MFLPTGRLQWAHHAGEESGLCRVIGARRNPDHTALLHLQYVHLSSSDTFKTFAFNEWKVWDSYNLVGWDSYFLTWKDSPFLEWDLAERGSKSLQSWLAIPHQWIIFLILQWNLPKKLRGNNRKEWNAAICSNIDWTQRLSYWVKYVRQRKTKTMTLLVGGNLKNNANESINKMETDSQIL